MCIHIVARLERKCPRNSGPSCALVQFTTDVIFTLQTVNPVVITETVYNVRMFVMTYKYVCIYRTFIIGKAHMNSFMILCMNFWECFNVLLQAFHNTFSKEPLLENFLTFNIIIFCAALVLGNKNNFPVLSQKLVFTDKNICW